MKIIRSALLVLCLACLSGAASADDLMMSPPLAFGGDPWFAQGQRQHGGLGNQMQRHKHIEQLRMLKLLELLDLSEDQETDFLVRFKRERDQQRELRDQHRAVVEELAFLAASDTASENSITESITRAGELMEARHQSKMRFIRETSDILTPAQTARLVVFMERFEYELLSRLGRFRQRRGGGGQLEDER